MIERAQQFVEVGGDEWELLREFVTDGGATALAATQLLAEDMYGGITFNLEIKAPAACALVAFGPAGLSALQELATRTPTSKNRSLCIRILSAVAAGSRMLDLLCQDNFLRDAVSRASEDSSLRDVARSTLREYVLGIEDDFDALSAVGQQLMTMGWGEDDGGTAIELFGALAARRLATGPMTISAYERLILDRPDDEPAFHEFFERHPQLLDPAVAEIWSKPDLSGAREPDFVLRRTDDTYLIVEIETPGKALMTEGRQLAAPATRAIAEATLYRDFLLERFPLASTHFPRFSDPDCLVVIGMEEGLNEEQRSALARDNRSRSGVRIVGFDWIARRATSIASNVVEPRLTPQSIRVV